MLCAGFPCQAFSISGKQQGFEDTRGTLFFDVARIIAHHHPKVLLLENVKNFARHDDGKTLATVIKTLHDLGYIVSHQVLNASHFGLPQNRERIYIVGVKNNSKDNFVNDKASGSQVANFRFPKPLHVPVGLQDLLESNPTAKVVQRDDINIYKDFEPEQDHLGQLILPNRPIQIGIVNKGGQGERIYHPLGHAITLSAHGGGVGSKTGLYLINGKIRKLSPRECARLQGFPDDFQIVSSPAQAYKQFGNSVAVNVLTAIIQVMIEQHIFEYENDVLTSKYLSILQSA